MQIQDAKTGSIQTVINGDGQPCVRFHYDNGWTASLRIASPFMGAEVVCWPTGSDSVKACETVAREATASEVAIALALVQGRAQAPEKGLGAIWHRIAAELDALPREELSAATVEGMMP